MRRVDWAAVILEQQRTEPKYKNVISKHRRITGVDREARDTAFAARVKSSEKGALRKTGNFEDTVVGTDSAAAAWEAYTRSGHAGTTG